MLVRPQTDRENDAGYRVTDYCSQQQSSDLQGMLLAMNIRGGKLPSSVETMYKITI
jgi:hypothetical protein